MPIYPTDLFHHTIAPLGIRALPADELAGCSSQAVTIFVLSPLMVNRGAFDISSHPRDGLSESSQQ
jgi:hypothetical protein